MSNFLIQASPPLDDSDSDRREEAVEELVNVAQNALKDIRMFLASEWRGDYYGLYGTATALGFALERLEGEG